MTSDQGYMPPHDIEIERCALGTAMLNPAAADAVVDSLKPEDFFRPAHQLIHGAMRGLSERNEPINPVTVWTEAESLRPEKAQPLDALYVHGMTEYVPIVGSIDFCISQLRDLSLLRQLDAASSTISAAVRAASAKDAPHVGETAQKLLDEAMSTVSRSSAQSVASLITSYMDTLESGGDQRGVTTGWKDVDRLLQRLRPGQLIVIGARPGQGKTVTLVDLAYHVGVKLGLPVYVNTLEMATKEFMDRLIAYDAKVNLSRLIEPELLDESDWGRLAGSIERMAAADNLIIDDDPHMGVAHIRAQLRSMRRAGTPAALACIDYLQLMQSTGRVENRQLEISEISRSLKLLAKEFQVPIVVGAQLNRNVEHRADKRPVKADLRESGSLENDADIVILLHREDAYDKESPKAGEIDFIVDKNRQGPQGTITLAFQGHYSAIRDMAKPEWSPTGGLS